MAADDQLVSLSTMPADRRQSRLVLGMLSCLLVALLVTAPFADRPLVHTEALVPAYAAAVLVNDLITSILLFALFTIDRSRALLILATGYLFAALMIIPWALTLPGVFTSTGLLDASLQSTAWIAALRRVGFPLFLLGYALSRNRGSVTAGPPGTERRMAVGAVAAVLVLASVSTWLILSGDAALPKLMADTTYVSALWRYVPIAATLISVAALLALWRGERSVLDLWLMAVICTWLFEIALLAFLGNGSRFTVGWWAGRLCGLASATLILLVLLAETTTLYTRLARALSLERRVREARLTTMEAVSASIAHEVNQPLASMVTNADAGLRWLERDQPDLDEVRAALTRIVADGHRAGSVIESIRAMYKTAARQRAALSLNALIDEVLGRMGPELTIARVTVQTDLDPLLPPVAGNPVQLQEVLANLIANAADAMSAITSRPRTLRIATTSDDSGGVVVAVEDSGMGLNKALTDRIFEPFYSTKAEGMGMGLMICRSIVEAHGGRLSVTSDEVTGTTFAFTLPAEEEHGPIAKDRAA